MNNANPLFSNHVFSGANFDQPGAAFDPAAFGINNAAPGTIDMSQFQNPQFQQRGPSPGFQHPSAFQTNPVIPAKRSRAGEDNMGASPRMPQNQFNSSRSHTPQQPNFPGSFPGQQFQGPAWSHLQQPPNSHASPSPQMPNQQFRPPGSQPPQRPQTHSPAHFLPNDNASNGSRMGTPQNPAMMAQMRGMPFGPGQAGMQPSPSQFPGGGNGAGQPGGPDMTAQAIEIQRQYQARLVQAQQQAMQQQGNRTAPNAMDPSQRQAWPTKANGQGSMPGAAAAAAAAAASNLQARGQQAGAQQAQQFVTSYLAWAQKQGIQADPSPKVLGRPIHYFQLFVQVTKLQLLMGPNQSNWGLLANALGFPEPQQPAAAQELKQMMEGQRLASFIMNYLQAMQKRRAAMAQGQGGPQHSPTQPSQPFGQTPQPSGTPTSQQASLPPQSSGMTQASPQQQKQQQQQQQQQRNPSVTADSNGISTPVSDAILKVQSPLDGVVGGSHMSPHVKAPSLPPSSAERPGSALVKSPAKATAASKPQKQRAQSPTYKPLVLPPGPRYGNLELGAVFPVGDDLDKMSLVVKANLLGAVDIHALTMALLSGLPMELANTLDTLAMVTQPELSRIYDIHLVECEELLDALVECAEHELGMLAAASQEASTEIYMPNFQKLARQSRSDSLDNLQERLEVGQHTHILRRSAERISAIMLILRNLSVPENELSRDILSSSGVVGFIAAVVRHLGTRRNFFLEDDMTVNIMKDLLIFLSNVATKVELPSEEDALAILHFLIAFSPSRSPYRSDGEGLEFTAYVPTEHQYLPYAVESLAKILARDDPNRFYYKAIFQADAAATPPCPLLVGAFALAIAPIPDRASRPLPEQYDRAIVKNRAAFFSMGMLAADILASLAPACTGLGSDSTICRSLLTSEDRWAQNLMHLVSSLAVEIPMVHPSMPRHLPPPQERDFSMVTTRGLSLLRKLGEKMDGGLEHVNGLMRLDEVIAHGLVAQQFDSHVLRQMVALSRLDS